MKLGILTLPLHINYGGILQAYALQTVLEQMGHEVVVVDLPVRKESAKNVCITYCKRWVGRYLLGRKKPLRAFPSKKEMKAISCHTSRFIGRYLSVVDCPDTALLPEITRSEKIEGYVVGSDQVWRPGYTPDLGIYFLDFLTDDTVERIAYAASFGVDYWEFSPEQTKKCTALAASFGALSVREDSGVMLCEKYLGRKAVQVLDPTLLLGAADYASLVAGKTFRSNVVATYLLDPDSSKEQWTAGIAARKELPVCSVGAKAVFWNAGARGLADCVVPPVEDWIGELMQADYVFTDSFHGTVFAILFHKPFICMVNPGRGATRFFSLLKLLGLENRMVRPGEPVNNDLIDAPVDYERVDKLLAEEQIKSRLFLSSRLDRK